MNCVNCGKPLRPGAVFCPQCGTPQPEQPDSQPAQHAAPPIIPDQEPEPYPVYEPELEVPDVQKKPRWPVIVGIVVAALCLLCACATVIAYVAYQQGLFNMPF